MSLESELKYTVLDPDIFTRLAAVTVIAGYSVEDAGVRRHTDTYFDTTERRLLSSRVVLRMRERVGRTTLTLKAEGGSDIDIHRRIEVNDDCDVTPDDVTSGRENWREPMREVFDRLGGTVAFEESLRAVNDRRTLYLLTGGARQFEVVLDTVMYSVAGGEACALELEVESLGGSDDDLRRVGAWLAARFDLAPAGPSKYALGMELAG